MTDPLSKPLTAAEIYQKNLAQQSIGGTQPRSAADIYQENISRLGPRPRPRADIRDTVPASSRYVDDASFMEFTGEALKEAVVGPFAGIFERLGFVDEGTRREIRDSYLAAKDQFVTVNDPVTGRPTKPLSRKVAANATAVAANLVPILPGGPLGRMAGFLYKGSKGAKIFRGALAGATEGGVVGFGDAALLPEGERGAPALLSVGLGAGLGALGGRLGVRAARRAEAERLGVGAKYIQDIDIDEGASPDDMLRAFRQQLFNEEEPLERVAQKLGKGGRMIELLTERLRKSRRTAVNPIFQKPEIWDGEKFIVPTVNGREAESLQEIIQRMPTGRKGRQFWDELNEYMLYRRELELRSRQFKGDPVKTLDSVGDDIFPFLERMSQRYGQRGKVGQEGLQELGEFGTEIKTFGALDEFAKDIRDWSHLQIKALNAADLISDGSMKRILTKNRNYASFHRIQRELTHSAKSSPSGASDLKSITHGLNADDKVLPPITEMALMSVRIQTAIDRQLVRKALVDAAEGLEPGMVPIRLKDSKVKDFSVADKAQRQEMGIEEADDIGAFFGSLDEPLSRDTFTVFRKDSNGDVVRQRWNAEADMLKAMKSLTPEQVGPVLRGANLFTRALRAGATVLSPAFAARNISRDQFTAAVHSKHGFIPFLTPIRGMMDTLTTDGRRLWSEFERSGVAGATMVGLDRASIRAQTDAVRHLGSKGKLAKFFNDTLRNPLYPVQALSELSEKATRFAEFRKAVKSGSTTLEAARDASEVSLNFARGGTFGRKWNMAEAFVNAELQDMAKLSKALKRHPFKTSVKAMTYITIPSMVNHFVNKDDPEYQARPEWEKALFFHVGKEFVPGLRSGQFIKVPRPIGALNVMYGMMPEAFARWLGDNDPEAAERLRKAVIDQTPMGMLVDTSGQRLASSITPTVLDPIMENIFNRDLFFEREIVPQRLQDELPEMQFNSSTPEIVKEIARPFNASPLKVMNIIEGYLATTGKAVARGVDIVALGQPASSPDPQIGSRGIPLAGDLLRAFVTEPVDSRDRVPGLGFRHQSISDFYDLLEKAEISKKRLERDTDIDSRRQSLSASPESILLPELRKFQKRLREHSERRRMLLNDAGLDQVDRQDRILWLDQIIATEAFMGMDRWSQQIMGIKERVDGGR